MKTINTKITKEYNQIQEDVVILEKNGKRMRCKLIEYDNIANNPYGL